MTTVTVNLDEQTGQTLQTLSRQEGVSASELASRLLRRAVRARRPRPDWDWERIQANADEFSAEDAALADSDNAHRASLLGAEDYGE